MNCLLGIASSLDAALPLLLPRPLPSPFLPSSPFLLPLVLRQILSPFTMLASFLISLLALPLAALALPHRRWEDDRAATIWARADVRSTEASGLNISARYVLGREGDGWTIEREGEVEGRSSRSSRRLTSSSTLDDQHLHPPFLLILRRERRRRPCSVSSSVSSLFPSNLRFEFEGYFDGSPSESWFLFFSTANQRQTGT